MFLFFFPQAVFPSHDITSPSSNHLTSQAPVDSSPSPGVNSHPFRETSQQVACLFTVHVGIGCCKKGPTHFTPSPFSL